MEAMKSAREAAAAELREQGCAYPNASATLVLQAVEAAGFVIVQANPERGVEEMLALRYADDPVEAFNLFIRAWVSPSWHAHLLDDDGNDGEFVRGHIRAAINKAGCP